MQPKTLAIVRKGDAKKGDVLGAARIAGIRRPSVRMNLFRSAIRCPSPRSKSKSRPTPNCRVVARARVKVAGKTGVEMEALTAVSVACLTIYDMVKAVDRGMRIEGIRLIEKRGGRSGHYRLQGVSGGAAFGGRGA